MGLEGVGNGAPERIRSKKGKEGQWEEKNLRFSSP